MVEVESTMKMKMKMKILEKAEVTSPAPDTRPPISDGAFFIFSLCQKLIQV